MLQSKTTRIITSWPLAIMVAAVPILIYILFFRALALNVNYVAFDDILILGIIPSFDGASWAQRWEALTTLFPEHRLVFSRTIVLTLYHIFGRLDLTWLMIVANICWAACAVYFYQAIRSLKLSFWYFVPVAWLWFNIQSFENILWGVSSLCNFGVLFFALGSIYTAAFKPKWLVITLLLAICATYSYGNGLMVFLVIAVLQILRRAYVQLGITILSLVIVSALYFSDFTPITQNLDVTDPRQIEEGILGLFGFLGSIASIQAYGLPLSSMYLASITGLFMVVLIFLLLWRQFPKFWQTITEYKAYERPIVLFAIGILIFVAITALALTYKRIPTDTYYGMFKGRYRMYSTLLLLAIYFLFLGVRPRGRNVTIKFLIPLSIVLNLAILHGNFAYAVDNRREAITQEFNARYNADWHGLRMFEMPQSHYEKIRALYHSQDPLAGSWNPNPAMETKFLGANPFPIQSISTEGEYLRLFLNLHGFRATKDYSDGVYAIMYSADHVYASPARQPPVPLRTTIRRGLYFSDVANIAFHKGTIAPGSYQLLLLVRQGAQNHIYQTGHEYIQP
ncbi:hypothetical protein [Dyadobacter tibetensis]|uniref:hypothetical protein n=1 Tax=Dyadobacter tibetensis TaxID=1211851 RepID=UPI0004712EB7|nr:hypothetical protein [Dyadobacter tibetensis]